MPTQPRRWLRFSLRTMFVVVTVICCYLGWQMSIVRQRQALRRELAKQPFVQVTMADAWLENQIRWGKSPRAAAIPRVRRWLGDEPVQEIAYGRGHHHLSPEQIEEIKRVFPEADVHDFEALFEPCHPGCFPRGTPVQTPDGPHPIELVRVGDPLTAFLADGRPIVAHVQSVFTTTNRLWSVETDRGTLLTTETQPLCLSCDRCVPAGDLRPGDQILHFTGGELQAARVERVTRTDRVDRVFNLVLGNRERFVAGTFLARSKPPADQPEAGADVANVP